MAAVGAPVRGQLGSCRYSRSPERRRSGLKDWNPARLFSNSFLPTTHSEASDQLWMNITRVERNTQGVARADSTCRGCVILGGAKAIINARVAWPSYDRRSRCLSTGRGRSRDRRTDTCARFIELIRREEPREKTAIDIGAHLCSSCARSSEPPDPYSEAPGLCGPEITLRGRALIRLWRIES